MIVFFFFLRISETTSLMYFGQFCFKRRQINVRETPCFVLTTLHVTQPRVCLHSQFSKLEFFSMTVFNTVCVNMVKNMNKCSMYFSSFNGWYLKYRTKPITINQVLNLHTCCRIRATRCVQQTMAQWRIQGRDPPPHPYLRVWIPHGFSITTTVQIVFCNRVL